MVMLAIAGRHISVIVSPGSTRECKRAHHFPPVKAYHISNDRYSIATADKGANATVKIWTARRSSSHLQGQVSGSVSGWRFESLNGLLAASLVPYATGMGRCCLVGHVDRRHVE
jgi:hypothetical protein